ncbi:hypothetical protein PBV87_16970 [Niameybacter massiliensis]|uniref:Uncharacterized protein n=1 Tax=Holtiella tumoricola TaxID=3018743 RepID=A0AA42J2L0_9FIRM|nr:DUF6625 family protein [Holtiella tumoricola]MDA3733171.1 hypothetical protein [Holtiella tumoricola]
MKNKRIAFIIPYFGKFNNYFELFLKSCEYNKEIADWIIFTDDKMQYNYPSNVIVHHISFDEMRNKITKKINFEISLNKPYKLCDYRVAYGYIFQEYLKEYSYWGYCDTDMIFGDIQKFINKQILDNCYDKLFIYGHCTIYKNESSINTKFMLPYKEKLRYQEVFKNPNNCSFDEEFKSSINNIFDEYDLKVFKEQYQANIYTKYSYFKLTYWDFEKAKYTNKDYKDKLFIWDKGKLFMYYKDKKGNLKHKEFMYIHLQSRKMQNDIKEIKGLNNFKIVPNKFEELEYNQINSERYSHIRKKYFNLHYIKLRIQNLNVKIKRRFIEK